MFQHVGLGRGGFALACVIFGGLALLGAPEAHAARLQVAPESPGWMHVGADILLWLHIGGGGIGIVTGMVALASHKGGRIHRFVGKTFFAAMLVSYGVAAGVAPLMHVEQRTNTFAGLIALYLLLSGWASAQRKEVSAGPVVFAGLAAALGIAGTGAFFVATGAGMTIGAAVERPDPVFYAFAMIGLIAALGEINVVVRGRISGPARLARHLWRMCLSLFIASGSFFFGQMQFLPGWLVESRLNMVLALTPLVGMLVWLVLVRLPKRRRRTAEVSAAAGPA